MEFAIEEDEAWPVYSLLGELFDGAVVVDLPEETVVRIRNAEAEYEACQDILSAAYDEACKKLQMKPPGSE